MGDLVELVPTPDVEASDRGILCDYVGSRLHQYVAAGALRRCVDALPPASLVNENSYDTTFDRLWSRTLSLAATSLPSEAEVPKVIRDRLLKIPIKIAALCATPFTIHNEFEGDMLKRYGSGPHVVGALYHLFSGLFYRPLFPLATVAERFAFLLHAAGQDSTVIAPLREAILAIRHSQRAPEDSDQGDATGQRSAGSGPAAEADVVGGQGRFQRCVNLAKECMPLACDLLRVTHVRAALSVFVRAVSESNAGGSAGGSTTPPLPSPLQAADGPRNRDSASAAAASQDRASRLGLCQVISEAAVASFSVAGLRQSAEDAAVASGGACGECGQLRSRRGGSGVTSVHRPSIGTSSPRIVGVTMENPGVVDVRREDRSGRQDGGGVGAEDGNHTPVRPSDAVASAARSSGSALVRGSSTGVTGLPSPPRCSGGASMREGGRRSGDAKDDGVCTCILQPLAVDRASVQPSAASLLSRGSAFGSWLTLAGDIVGCDPLTPPRGGGGEEFSMEALVDPCGDAVDAVATQLAALDTPDCLRVGPVADAALLALTSGGLADMLTAIRAAIKYTAVCYGVEAALADACLYGLRGCAPVCDDSVDGDGGVGAGLKMIRLTQREMAHPYATGDCTEFATAVALLLQLHNAVEFVAAGLDVPTTTTTERSAPFTESSGGGRGVVGTEGEVGGVDRAEAAHDVDALRTRVQMHASTRTRALGTRSATLSRSDALQSLSVAALSHVPQHISPEGLRSMSPELVFALVQWGMQHVIHITTAPAVSREDRPTRRAQRSGASRWGRRSQYAADAAMGDLSRVGDGVFDIPPADTLPSPPHHLTVHGTQRGGLPSTAVASTPASPSYCKGTAVSSRGGARRFGGAVGALSPHGDRAGMDGDTPSHSDSSSISLEGAATDHRGRRLRTRGVGSESVGGRRSVHPRGSGGSPWANPAELPAYTPPPRVTVGTVVAAADAHAGVAPRRRGRQMGCSTAAKSVAGAGRPARRILQASSGAAAGGGMSLPLSGAQRRRGADTSVGMPRKRRRGDDARHSVGGVSRGGLRRATEDVSVGLGGDVDDVYDAESISVSSGDDVDAGSARGRGPRGGASAACSRNIRGGRARQRPLTFPSLPAGTLPREPLTESADAPPGWIASTRAHSCLFAAGDPIIFAAPIVSRHAVVVVPSRQPLLPHVQRLQAMFATVCEDFDQPIPTRVTCGAYVLPARVRQVAYTPDDLVPGVCIFGVAKFVPSTVTPLTPMLLLDLRVVRHVRMSWPLPMAYVPAALAQPLPCHPYPPPPAGSVAAAALSKHIRQPASRPLRGRGVGSSSPGAAAVTCVAAAAAGVLDSFASEGWSAGVAKSRVRVTVPGVGGDEKGGSDGEKIDKPAASAGKVQHAKQRGGASAGATVDHAAVMGATKAKRTQPLTSPAGDETSSGTEESEDGSGSEADTTTNSTSTPSSASADGARSPSPSERATPRRESNASAAAAASAPLSAAPPAGGAARRGGAAGVQGAWAAPQGHVAAPSSLISAPTSAAAAPRAVALRFGAHDQGCVGMPVPYTHPPPDSDEPSAYPEWARMLVKGMAGRTVRSGWRVGHPTLVHQSDGLVGRDISTDEPYRHRGKDVGVIVRLFTPDWALVWGRNIPTVCEEVFDVIFPTKHLGVVADIPYSLLHSWGNHVGPTVFTPPKLVKGRHVALAVDGAGGRVGRSDGAGDGHVDGDTSSHTGESESCDDSEGSGDSDTLSGSGSDAMSDSTSDA